LAALLKKLRVEAIILNLSSDVKFAGIAAKAAGIKKIIYRRGLPVPVVNNIMNRFIFRRILTHVIANSRAIKARILQNNLTLIPENKITVIYNGVDAPVDAPTPDPIPLFSQAHGVLIGSAGRLSKEKRQEALIDMAGILHRKNLDFSLFIAGKGNLLDSLNRQVMEQGLGKVVVLPGFISNIDMFYHAVDIFILASTWEGCSNAILEAMQHGLPVIAFDNSSFRELVEHENTGFLARDGDVADLADKAEILIRDPDMRKRFGAAARDSISIKFSREKSLDLLENLLCS
jgi:glycosyltransferase involved in cell wall biosynthesis